MFCSFFLSFFSTSIQYLNVEFIKIALIYDLNVDQRDSKTLISLTYPCWSWIFFCQFRMGDAFKNVDTSKFRVATWNYIHLVYGIFHDDYQYVEVCTTSVVSKDWHKMVHCYSKILEILLDTVYWEVLPLYFGCVPILCHLSSHFTA